MQKPKKYTATVAKKAYLNSKVVEITLELPGNEVIDFEAGQFINIKTPEGVYRSYSIYTSCRDHNKIGILAAVAHDGKGSNYLKNLNLGDEVEFIGPSGKFLLPQKLSSDLIFIATGTGIAPFLSMLLELRDRQEKEKLLPETKVRLYFGVRNEEELIKVDELTKLTAEIKNFNYYLCFSQLTPGSVDNKKALFGRVTTQLNFKEEISKDAQFFICGNPAMIDDALKLLKEQGVLEENIFHEKFTVSIQNSIPEV
jgi:ferredoxin-NADP reductase